MKHNRKFEGSPKSKLWPAKSRPSGDDFGQRGVPW